LPSAQLLSVVSLIWQHVSTSEGHLQTSSITDPLWSEHVAKLKIQHLIVMLMANSLSCLLYLAQQDDKDKNFVTVNTLKCKGV